jgi:hypothetical protein
VKGIDFKAISASVNTQIRYFYPIFMANI